MSNKAFLPKLSIVIFGLIGCFLGFMGSSLASDLSAKNLLSINVRPLIGYAASGLGVAGIFLSYSKKRAGAYLLFASVAAGLLSISVLFIGAAFFYLSSAIFCIRNTAR